MQLKTDDNGVQVQSHHCCHLWTVQIKGFFRSILTKLVFLSLANVIIITVVFVRPHANLFAIRESGNIRFKVLELVT